jgi:hypothetical protein
VQKVMAHSSGFRVRGSGFRDEVYGLGFTAFGFGVMFQAVGVRLTINPKP